jgi:nitrile hydratase subunit beta
MPALSLDQVPGLLSTGASGRSPETVDALHKAGDTIVARNINPVNHTRLPRYVRGKRGVVVFDHGVFTFPDTGAHGLGHKAQHVYSVKFTARELWGEDAPAKDSLYIDLFEDYIEPAKG